MAEARSDSSGFGVGGVTSEHPSGTAGLSSWGKQCGLTSFPQMFTGGERNVLEKVKGARLLLLSDSGHGRWERSWVPGGVQTWSGSLTDPKSHTQDSGEGWQESGLGRGLV